MSRNNPSKALIIGNGFDLAHFLPTSYGEFITFVKIIERYKNQPNTTKIAFSDLFVAKNGELGFEEVWLKNVRKNYDTEHMIFDISPIFGKLKNYWLNHFKYTHEIETWIDFENEIGSTINAVSDFLLVSKKVVNKGHEFTRTISNDGDRDEFFHHEKAHKLYNLNIFKELKNGLGYQTNVYDAALFYVNPIYLKKSNRVGKLGVDGASIFEYLFEQLNDLISLFTLYLIEVVDVFAKNVRKEKLNAFEHFDEIYSFNYTKTINNFHPNNSNSVMYHLHGAVNEKKIVLGVSKIDDAILEISALNFTKYYQTIFNETQSSFLDDEECKTQDFCGVDYYVWGHSLDRSDEKYIKRLFYEISFDRAGARSIAHFNYYHDRSMREGILPSSSITIYYHNSHSKARLLKNLLAIIGKDVIEQSIRTKHLQLVEAPKIWVD